MAPVPCRLAEEDRRVVAQPRFDVAAVVQRRRARGLERADQAGERFARPVSVRPSLSAASSSGRWDGPRLPGRPGPRPGSGSPGRRWSRPGCPTRRPPAPAPARPAAARPPPAARQHADHAWALRYRCASNLQIRFLARRHRGAGSRWRMVRVARHGNAQVRRADGRPGAVREWGGDLAGVGSVVTVGGSVGKNVQKGCKVGEGGVGSRSASPGGGAPPTPPPRLGNQPGAPIGPLPRHLRPHPRREEPPHRSRPLPGQPRRGGGARDAPRPEALRRRVAPERVREVHPRSDRGPAASLAASVPTSSGSSSATRTKPSSTARGA